MSIEFLLTSLAIVASPGTGVLYTLAAGLSSGVRASVFAAFACTLGILPHIAAALTGLAAVLHASALAFEIIKYLGVAYLLYMAWRTIMDREVLSVDEQRAPRTVRQTIVDGILLNILNPKLSIFFFAFLPQFVSPTQVNVLPEMLVLSGAFMAITFVVFVGYGVFAASMRRHVISRPVVVNWMRRTFAAAFLAMGAKLALTER
ncbi:LysE family translocator [Rhizobium halophilum]|uniref:LysE family translocator n=1 Tax=Rhizobium halophilum TaxID=2846852 RepID=UPI001EFEB712|nr:LysE family translocator [Rhizobium halophilum]MCF6368376.1 LysE family translocator [Rhizobium halophilum]